MPKNLEVSSNIPQANFLSLPHKFRAFVAGYGTGKTWVGCMSQCIHYLKHPKSNQGYFAPTYPQIRDIFYPTIEEVAHGFGLKTQFKTSDKEVSFYSGSRYRGTSICRSMDRPESIVGFKIGNALVDELDTLNMDKAESSWRKIIARMRDNRGANGIDVTTTPEGFRFVYKQFKENPTPSYGLVHASTYDNAANLPNGYIESLVETYPDNLIEAYLNGQFVNLTSGTVFNSYDRVRCRSSETIQEKEPLRIGMDFNVTNMSAVIYVLRDDNWHAVSELSGIYDTPAMIDVVKQKWPEHNIRIYPDASGKSRKTVDASISDITLLEQAGFMVYANPSNPLVKDRVIATNKALSSGRMLINDSLCPEFAKCLEQLAYDKNGEPDKKSNLDHLPDAGTYPIAFEMPIQRPVAQLSVNFAR